MQQPKMRSAANPRRETSVNWLREELREWAKWYLGRRNESESSGDGYSGTTTIGRAMSGHISHPPSSCIPHGVEPPADLQAICHAMINLLTDHRLGKYVFAMREFYLAGENVVVVMEIFQCGQTAAYALRERGEDAMRAFLRA